MSEEIKAVKNEDSELPIPNTWRPIIKNIVNGIVEDDFNISGVDPIPEETRNQIRDYIKSYGATLTDLSDETWSTSICIWMGNQWDVLIDLWTKEEGCSDLVLSLNVTEKEDGYRFNVYMVYVP
jgi:predicted component of viral defense system (DUF524 family)